MLNKKLLAVAVAAAMTQGIAHANPNQEAVTLFNATGTAVDVADSTVVKYVDELTWGAERVIVENDNEQTLIVSPTYGTSTPSNMTADIGFTIAEGTNKYIRIDLGSPELRAQLAAGDISQAEYDAKVAKFDSVPRLRWDTVDLGGSTPARAADIDNTGTIDADAPSVFNGRPNPQSSISEGGEGFDYVIFEVNAFEADNNENEDIPSFLSFYVEVDAYDVPTDVSTDARYRLYEDAVDAQRENAETLRDSSEVALLNFQEGVADEFAIPNNAYASVDSEYTVFIHGGSQFADHDETNYYDEQQNGNDSNNDAGFDGVGSWDGAALSATTASLGEVDTNRLTLSTTTVTPLTALTDLDGYSFTNDDVIGLDPHVVFTAAKEYGFGYGAWSLREVPNPRPAVVHDACNTSPMIYNPVAPQSTDQTLYFDVPQQELEDKDFILCVDASGLDSDTTDNLLVGENDDPWAVTSGNAERILESGDVSATITWSSVSGATPIVDIVADSSGSFSLKGWDETLGALVNNITVSTAFAGRTQTGVTDGMWEGQPKAGMGSVIYDSITVDVPFMSTFTDYVQRFHLTNAGPTDASYMFTLINESGKEAAVLLENGKSSGVIPANSSIVVQAKDVFEFTSGKVGRTAAQLHIGGEDEDIGVSAIVVNPEKGTIDVQDLNANSIKARKSNNLPEANNVN
jgi:hypothetical protein